MSVMPTYVVARDDREFVAWCRVKGLRPYYDAKRLTEPQDLYGLCADQTVWLSPPSHWSLDDVERARQHYRVVVLTGGGHVID